jgi:hypothetical protein
MTALTANRYTKFRDGLITAHPVKANARIYKGGLVCADATGYALPGADVAGQVFLGVALEECDNTGGADGARSVRVQAHGVFCFAKTGSIAQAQVGAALYIYDDQTVALAATTANDIACGRVEALDGSDVWVRLKL